MCTYVGGIHNDNMHYYMRFRGVKPNNFNMPKIFKNYMKMDYITLLTHYYIYNS